MPSSYILRDLTPEQSDAFVAAGKRAKAEGRSFRWIVIRLVERYAAEGMAEKSAGESSHDLR